MSIISTEIFVLITTTFLCIWMYIRWSFNFWKRLNVPYKEPKLPMGNFETPWLVKRGYHQTLQDLHLHFKSKGYKHGGVFSAMRPIYMPVDIDLLKSILVKDFQHFVDRGHYYNEENEPLSAHLFNIDGDKWRHLRMKLSPTFTSGRMKAMFNLVIECANGLESEINKASQKKESLDIKEICALFTTNVIGTCAFGLDCNCFEDPNNDFRHHTRVLFRSNFLTVLRKFAQVSFPDICKRFGLLTITKEASQFYLDLTKSVVDHREKTSMKRNDFMQLLLEIKNTATKAEDSLTLEQIAAQTFIFFLAGFETSSSTMTFAFYEMAKNQDIQDKVRDEINKVLEKHGKLSYDAVQEMTYMQQVIDETLRKYPIVATLDRICTKDYNVPGEDLIIKKDTKLLISLLGLHYDPEFYPDPEKFDPERFTQENKAKLPMCAYLPFGEGPRICIGMRFGLMQAKIGMSLMLKDYRYKLNPKIHERHIHCKSRLLSPDGDMLMDIEKLV